MLEKLKASIQAGDEGTFKAIASGAGSIAYGERGPTRFAKGAFAETLKASGGKYPLLWQHRDDQPIGVVNLAETSEGLTADGRLAMDVQQGKEAHSLLKMGGIDGVSIGFNVKKAKQVTDNGESVREVERADLAEVSLVTFPADKEARVQQVHNEAAEVEAELGELSSLIASMENLASHTEEGQSGKVFSAANLKKIREALASLVALVEKVDPGHIATLGRKAARILKKSFLNTKGAKARQRRRTHIHAMAELRAAQMRLAYPGVVDIDDIPPARLFDEIKEDEDKREEAWRLQSALMDSIRSILLDPRVSAKGDMVRDTVNQYLIALGEAEGNDDDDEDDAGIEPGERHIHDPRVEKRGEKWAVVDADGKVYGEHDTKKEAEAQRRALSAAKD